MNWMSTGVILFSLILLEVSRVLHPFHYEKAECPREAQQHHDQQLPAQQEVATVEEGHSSKDGLQRGMEDGVSQ